jgi:hypothetical protein
MSPQLKALADNLIVNVKGYVERVERALSSRIDALAEQIKAVRADKDGKDGTSVSKAEVAALVRAAVAEMAPLAAGKAGVKGKDADPAE